MSAGHCQICEKKPCARVEGKPCLHPELMRYSVESLGGNVERTVELYLKQKILWIENGRIPEHFMLLCGLLLP